MSESYKLLIDNYFFKKVVPPTLLSDSKLWISGTDNEYSWEWFDILGYLNDAMYFDGLISSTSVDTKHSSSFLLITLVPYCNLNDFKLNVMWLNEMIE